MQVRNEQKGEKKWANISEICQGLLSTIHKVETDFKIEDILIGNESHVVRDEFPIPCNIIIGMDFIRKYRCILDYLDDNDSIIFNPDKNAPNTNSTTLPARSEVIRLVCIQSTENEVLIPHQMLQDGVYVANTVTLRSRPLVKIVNTTYKNLIVKNVHIRTENHNDYDFVQHSNSRKSEKSWKDWPKIFLNLLMEN